MGVIYSVYTFFDGSTEGFSWTMIPLLAGAKFNFSPKQCWYIATLLGANFVATDFSITLFGETSEGSESSTEFAGNVNFGYEIKTSEKGAVDISADYVYINQLNYFGMRLAYIFKI